MSFDQLGLSSDLLQAVKYAGYSQPTAIQVQSIPVILSGKDLIAQAKTGTGKTASFALPILQLLQQSSVEKHRSTKALILTPTRELAMQVNASIKAYGRQLTRPFKTALIVGGLNIDVQLRELMHGVDIVVATPGRLLDVTQRQVVDLKRLKYLVIDEADKMFDLGFTQELESVLKLLPFKRQNLLFSATIDDQVIALSARFMPQAVSIKIEDTTPTAAGIHQRAIEVNRNNRGPLLRHLFQTEKWQGVLVFVASIRAADMLMAKLNKAHIKTESFHGALTQAQRSNVLQAFKEKKFDVLVATDLAARGIDIEKLQVVVNYDLPRSTEDYIHRIGRTARAGQTGMAVSFIGHEDQAHFKLIEKRVRIQLPRESVQGLELVGNSLPVPKGNLPIKGKRLSKKDKARLGLTHKGE